MGLWLSGNRATLCVMTEDTTSADTHIAPARTRAARRRAAAEATARWRGMRRAVGMPEAIEVDRAIREAVTFSLQPQYSLHDADGVYISVERIFRTAVLVLQSNGADPDLAQEAVRKRLHPRDAHDRVGNVPSHAMHLPGFRPLPRKGDLEWTEADLRAMAAASRPRRDHGV